MLALLPFNVVTQFNCYFTTFYLLKIIIPTDCKNKFSSSQSDFSCYSMSKLKSKKIIRESWQSEKFPQQLYIFENKYISVGLYHRDSKFHDIRAQSRSKNRGCVLRSAFYVNIVKLSSDLSSRAPRRDNTETFIILCIHSNKYYTTD
jgi:hypothetical protein